VSAAHCISKGCGHLAADILGTDGGVVRTLVSDPQPSSFAFCAANSSFLSVSAAREKSPAPPVAPIMAVAIADLALSGNRLRCSEEPDLLGAGKS